MSKSSVSIEERREVRSALLGNQQSQELPQRLPVFVRATYASDLIRDQEFASLNRKVDCYGLLAPNWDSYCAQPLGRNAIDFLHQVLQLAATYVRITPPAMSPIDSGALLEWNLPHGVSAYVEISDRSIVFVVKRYDREIADGADAPFSLEAIDKALRAIHCEMVDV